MAWEQVNGTARLLTHAAGVMLRRAVVGLEAGPFARWRWPGPTPERLVIAPQDIRTADPTLAADIYAGIFTFAGKVVQTGGLSPFEVPPPSLAWQRQLHAFGWLRHLRAADGALTRQNARALVADWIAQESRAPSVAFEGEVLARRVLAWITQSPLILEDADRAFYRRFLKSLVRQVRRLRARFLDAADGYPRLISVIAVAEAALSMEGQQRLVRQATHRLDQELTRQVLADGGHVSRNPGVILELLTDLLPLRQAYAARGLSPSTALMTAIDRMMPMLRFFRHADGTFGHFNGMGSTPADQLATVLAYDDARGRPVQNASWSGYQRMEIAGTVVLMDTGTAPPLAISRNAHAGFLSFEMSSGGHRFVVNCGSSDDERWRAASRSTPAHSTLIVDDASSARFVRAGDMLMIGGPREVPVTREERSDGILVSARHDGYLPSHGVIHERALLLAPDGSQILGVDRVSSEGKKARADRFAVRFHLHPAIRASRTEGGEVLLLAPDGEAWVFAAREAQPELAESVYLSDVHGRRRTTQIVLNGRVGTTPEINWTMTRTGAGSRSRLPRTRGDIGGIDLFG